MPALRAVRSVGAPGASRGPPPGSPRGGRITIVATPRATGIIRDHSVDAHAPPSLIGRECAGLFRSSA